MPLSEISRRFDIAPTTLRHACQRGKLRGVFVLWGTRSRWAASEAEVQRWLALPSSAVTDVAAQVGLSYHQTYTLMTDLGLHQTAGTGQPVELTEDARARVLAEVDRRETQAVALVTLLEAARQLDLALTCVEMLYRRGTLAAAPSPTGSRQRFVTQESVARYDAEHPALQKGVTEPEDLLPLAVVRNILEVTRPTMAHLVLTRQVVATTYKRRQVISRPSAIAYATRTRRKAAIPLLQAASVAAE